MAPFANRATPAINNNSIRRVNNINLNERRSVLRFSARNHHRTTRVLNGHHPIVAPNRTRVRKLRGPLTSATRANEGTVARGKRNVRHEGEVVRRVTLTVFHRDPYLKPLRSPHSFTTVTSSRTTVDLSRATSQPGQTVVSSQVTTQS